MGTTLTPNESSVTRHNNKVNKQYLPLNPILALRLCYEGVQICISSMALLGVEELVRCTDSNARRVALSEWSARLPYILTNNNLAVRIPLEYKTFRRSEAGGHWSWCSGLWREGEGSW